MPEYLDIHAMLLRAELKAKTSIEAIRISGAFPDFHARLELLEEAYATACAVRRNWEDCERRASKENQSASSYK